LPDAADGRLRRQNRQCRFPIPAIDHSLGFGARRPVGSKLGCAGFDVWSACPDAHPASIMVPAE
jgi:hypothetical protein